MKVLKEKFKRIIDMYEISDAPVNVKARALTPQEAIGNPEDQDYPLVKGKERLMCAEYKGIKGVAFSDMWGNYTGTLYEIMNMELKNNYRRAIFISTLNAVLSYLGLISKTIHCKDSGPRECSLKLPEFIKKRYGNVKVTLVGYQPRFAEVLSENFSLRILDLDAENIGKKIGEAVIESEENYKEAIHWADLLFVTGSTFVNNTYKNFLIKGKKVIFYGVTCAAPVYILSLPRFCACGISE